MQKKKKGFTLIELLIVIAVIQILATTIVYFLGQARVKSRDAERLSDMKEMAKALEMYLDDCHGFPSRPVAAAGEVLGTGNMTSSQIFSGCTGKTLGDFIHLPTDPTNQDEYVYTYCATNSSGTCVQYPVNTLSPSYKIVFYLEAEAGSLQPGRHCMTAGGVVSAPAPQC